MKQRVTSGLVFAVIAIAALLINIFFGYSLTVVAAAVAFMCIYELYKCVEVPVKGIYFMYSEVFTVSTLLCFIPGYPHSLGGVLPYIQAGLLAIYFIVSAANGLLSRDGIIKTLLLNLITVLIVITFSILAYWGGVRTVAVSGESYNPIGVMMLMITLLSPFGSDIAGYFVGSAIGKHKMAPVISPKKSWEGFIGSLLGAPLIMMLIGFGGQSICAACKVALNVNYLSLFISGLIGAVIGTLGDLFFSIIKRKAGIKDYGSVMPGHGGMLDRFDSVTFTTPLVFLLYFILPQFSV